MNLTAQAYLHRMDSLAALQAAWSPVCTLPGTEDTGILTASMSAITLNTPGLLAWFGSFGIGRAVGALEGRRVQGHAA